DSSSDNETKMTYFTNYFGVSTVIYSTVPIEYPATSSEVLQQFLVYKDGKTI
ncbi:8082_t:CDS:1, partial [Funneliformis mosseae]